MDADGALTVADKATDRTLPAAEHPALQDMIYALEILADGHRRGWEQAKAWEASASRMQQRAMDATVLRDRAVRDLESANAELDRTQGHWSDLMEFIRTALGLSPQSLGVDKRALRDKTDPRSILGQVFADARLLRRVRAEVNGDFVAGGAVTADAVNTLGPVVETFTVRPDPGQSVKMNRFGLYVAPEGTDPRDTGKWTLIGTVPNPGWTIVESRKKTPAPSTKLGALFASTGQTFADATEREPRSFAMGSAEPEGVKRVGRVSNPNITFTWIGALPNGNGVWRRDGDDLVPLLEWSNIVRYLPVVEVL